MNRVYQRRRAQRGFTLIELLTVIGIITVLAGMLFPVLAKAKVRAQVAKSKTEIKNIEAAILQYQQTYGRMPAWKRVREASTTQSPDFTFGTMHNLGGASAVSLVNKRKQAYTPAVQNPSGTYQASNAEIVATLRDVEKYRDGNRDTPNLNHAQNPQQTAFLQSRDVDFMGSSGVDPYGVFRDVWGNPYIISIDLNDDGLTRDGFHQADAVSAGQNNLGINGLTRAAGANTYESRSPVMIWSFGPDGQYSTTTKANVGLNKDNVLSWK